MSKLTQAAHYARGCVVSIALIDKPRGRLDTLAKRYSARLLPLPSGPRGRLYNAAANTSPADVLVFLDPLVELPADWLANVDHALASQQQDVVALISDAPALPAWLGRLCHIDSRILALCIHRTWFERVGGFDMERNSRAERDLLSRLAACHARVLLTPTNKRCKRAS